MATMPDDEEIPMTRNASGLLLAFLGGAMAGVAVAYLTAPTSGVKMRERLRKLVETRDENGRIPGTLSDAIDSFGGSVGGGHP
jgi:gas vesicle protein